MVQMNKMKKQSADEEKEWISVLMQQGGGGQEDLRLCDSLCLPAARLIRIESAGSCSETLQH